jgi:HK97 gp10 family phage protein
MPTVAPTLTIQVDDKQLRRLYKKYPAEIDDAFKRILTDGSIIVQKRLRENAPVGVTQDLSRKIQRTVSKSTARIRPMAGYTYWVENGRGAGKAPPWSGSEGEDFRKWVALKMGSSVPPFVVARAIGKKGTKAQPFVKPTYDDTKPIVTRYAQSEVTRLVGVLNNA